MLYTFIWEASGQMDYLEQVGNGLKKLRNMRGLTQLEASALANITPVSLARIECGKQNVKRKTLKRICAVYGYEPKITIEFVPTGE